jgi:hypothetical protein
MGEKFMKIRKTFHVISAKPFQIVVWSWYLEAVQRSGEGCFQCFAGIFGCEIFGPDLLEWALVHADGVGCSRGKLQVFDDHHPDQDASFYMAGQMILEMISRQATSELLLSGPICLCQELKKAFLPDGKYAVGLNSNQCEIALRVEIVSLFDLPPIRTTELSDVQLNENATHDGPSEQLFSALASVASSLQASAKNSPVFGAQNEDHLPSGSHFVIDVFDDETSDSACSDSERSNKDECACLKTRKNVQRCLRPLDAPQTNTPKKYKDTPATAMLTPFPPLPPLTLEADALCIRSREAGCCVTGGVQKLAAREVWSEAVRV